MSYGESVGKYPILHKGNHTNQGNPHTQYKMIIPAFDTTTTSSTKNLWSLIGSITVRKDIIDRVNFILFVRGGNCDAASVDDYEARIEYRRTGNLTTVLKSIYVLNYAKRSDLTDCVRVYIKDNGDNTETLQIYIQTRDTYEGLHFDIKDMTGFSNGARIRNKEFISLQSFSTLTATANLPVYPYFGVTQVDDVVRRTHVYKAQTSADQTTTNNAVYKINFDSSLINEGGITQSGTSITLPETGYYRIDAIISYVNNATGTRRIILRLNFNDYDSKIIQSVNGANTFCEIHDVYKFNANDVLELVAFQTSGGNLNVAGTQTKITITKVTL